MVAQKSKQVLGMKIFLGRQDQLACRVFRSWSLRNDGIHVLQVYTNVQGKWFVLLDQIST